MTDYWIKQRLCYYNAFYNVYFLNNTATHRVRCGEVWFNGKQKTDGELHWKLDDFNCDLSNAHFWVETDDGKIIDWIASILMKNKKVKVWDKAELEANGFEYKYYENEKIIFDEAFFQYGDTNDEERSIGGEMK